ncbi:hypothetical protein ACKU07_23395, partial [Enterobacter hormaechei]
WLARARSVAIEKIKGLLFQITYLSLTNPRGGSIGEQLQSYGYTGNGMFPRKGYAGSFRFVEAKKKKVNSI